MGIAVAIIFFVAVIFALIYVYLVMPRVRDRADMDMLVCDYAHRGLWNETYPENSLAAFARAAQAGYGIELDIQLSKDNVIMVFHDYDLKRMCGIDKKLSELTAAELGSIRLLGSNQCIPRFSDVLKVVDGKVPLLVELKGEDSRTELCKRVAAMLDKYHGAFCIESFNPLLLSWFRKYRPSYARGQLNTKLTKKANKMSWALRFTLTHMLLNVISRPDFIAIDGRYRNSPRCLLCERVFKSRVFVWTVRGARDYKESHREGRYTIFEKILP